MRFNLIRTVILLFLTSITAFAQIKHEKRIDLEREGNDNNKKVYLFNQQGLIYIVMKYNSENDRVTQKYSLYNLDLEKIKSETFEVSETQRCYKHVQTDRYLHSLFSNSELKYTLISADVRDLSTTQVTGVFPEETHFVDLFFLNKKAVVLRKKKKKLLIVTIDLETGASETIPLDLPIEKGRKAVLLNAPIIKESNELFLIIGTEKINLPTKIFIFRFNETENLLKTSQFTQELDKYIQSIWISKVGNEYIYTGSFSKDVASNAKGLFFGKGDGINISFIKYYNYAEFSNLWELLPKYEKKKKLPELKTNYNIVSHEVVSTNGGYQFIGELYSAVFSTPSSESKMIHFLGYRYSYAIVVKFDKTGEILWDRSFKMYDCLKPLTPKEFIAKSLDNENLIKLSMLSCDSVHCISYDINGNLVKNMKSEKLALQYKNDELKWTYHNLYNWYEDRFVSFGIQQIKNKKNSSVKKKRWTFYINKLKYE